MEQNNKRPVDQAPVVVAPKIRREEDFLKRPDPESSLVQRFPVLKDLIARSKAKGIGKLPSIEEIRELQNDPNRDPSTAKLLTHPDMLKYISEAKASLEKYAWAFKKYDKDALTALTAKINDIESRLNGQKSTFRVLSEELMLFECEVSLHSAVRQAQEASSERTHILKQFAENHAVVMYGGKACLRREDEHDWVMPDQLAKFYGNIDVPGENGKPENVVYAYMGWDHARRYANVTFDPARPGHHGGNYNLWQGWMVEPEEDNDDALWWDILAAACGYNPDYIDYVGKWFADLIQNPGRLPGTALGISGPQGVGKSALVETVGMLMSTINRLDDRKVVRGAYGDFSMDELQDKYNEHIGNKLLTYLDEATFGGSPKDAQVMKVFITKAEENINPKFIGMARFPRSTRTVFSSNNPFYYRPDEDDRRLLPLEYDASKVNDKSYAFWDEFYEKRGKGKMLANLLHNLKQIDLTGWHPQTALKKLRITTGGSMMANTLQPFEHWLEEIATKGTITIEVDGEKRKYEEVMPIENRDINDEDFENAALLWSRKHRVNSFWTSDAFKKKRTKMLGPQHRRMVSGVKMMVREVPSSEEMLKRLHEGRRWVTPKDEVIDDTVPKTARKASADASLLNVDNEEN